MGSSESSEVSSFGSRKVFDHETVDQIPDGVPPSPVSEINEKVKEFAHASTQKFDPADLRTCQSCKKTSDGVRSAEMIRDDLASYTLDQPAFSEKTYVFSMGAMPEFWITSTKNSDHTISYWFQYPIHPFHIQAGMLQMMNIPITPENLSEIIKRYPGTYKHLLALNKNEVSKCEQVEPLYVDTVLKALLSRGYKAQIRHTEIE